MLGGAIRRRRSDGRCRTCTERMGVAPPKEVSTSPKGRSIEYSLSSYTARVRSRQNLLSILFLQLVAHSFHNLSSNPARVFSFFLKSARFVSPLSGTQTSSSLCSHLENMSARWKTLSEPSLVELNHSVAACRLLLLCRVCRLW